jgi:hypothetical protein
MLSIPSFTKSGQLMCIIMMFRDGHKHAVRSRDLPIMTVVHKAISIQNEGPFIPSFPALLIKCSIKLSLPSVRKNCGVHRIAAYQAHGTVSLKLLSCLSCSHTVFQAITMPFHLIYYQSLIRTPSSFISSVTIYSDEKLTFV